MLRGYQDEARGRGESEGRSVILLHASSVKTSMHRIRLPSFLRSIFAEKVRAHRVLISTNSSFWLNSKM